MLDLSADSPEGTILIVEDDEALRTLFVAILQRHGYCLEFVTDGAQALDRLASSNYSVILLDLMMPVKNGFDVLEHFSQSQPHLLRRTIVTTGASERDLTKLDRTRVFALLRKPFDVEELVATILECSRQNRVDGSVRRFEAAIPEIRSLLRSGRGSEREMLLRHELRNIIGQVGTLFLAAATMQPDDTRAAQFERIGDHASQIAALRAAKTTCH